MNKSDLPNDNNIQRRLNVIWLHAEDHEQWRYIPRHNGKSRYGWNVWDKKRERFLRDSEVKRLSFDDCCERWSQ